MRHMQPSRATVDLMVFVHYMYIILLLMYHIFKEIRQNINNFEIISLNKFDPCSTTKLVVVTYFGLRLLLERAYFYTHCVDHKLCLGFRQRKLFKKIINYSSVLGEKLVFVTATNSFHAFCITRIVNTISLICSYK